ncbi:glycosyl hydrolase family 18 protein [Aquimarina algiphila]|uniref:glycosyl hydrolase family 18 protein n=1 Tax=Aquimarina algiphila TaxID=2047982 RepID=UPI00248F8638|nr:glycosyl hydrolase family 18 protein [Aquimarina algiphila]
MKKFYYRFPLIFLMTWMFVQPIYAQKRVGYMQSWKAQITADQASKLTHVIYSFATIHPDLDGKLNAIDGAYLSTMTSIAHAQGAKAILAVGGWFPCSYANQSGPCAADANPEAFNSVAQGNSKTNFVNNLYNMVVQYNMDGIDVDWEYPSASSQGLYVDLLAALRAKMNTHPTKQLELSTAVPASAFRGQHFSSAAFQYLDGIHIMAYDNSPRINHSTYTFAAGGIDYWQSRGVTNSKLQLGLPFYGWNSSGASMAYKDIVAADSSAPNKVYPNNNTCDQSNGYGYNAKKLIEDKVQLTLNENIGGVMIWAVDQDHANPSYSLLNTIDAKLDGGSGPGGPGGGGSCTQWSAGTQYYVGDIVTYQGSNYICVNDNPGYDPVISHWFWDPSSQNCDGGSGGDGGACAPWTAGAQYYTGDIVSYGGSNYICEHDNPGYDPVISHWFWEPTSASCSKATRLNTASQASKNMNVRIYPNPLSNNVLNLSVESNKISQINVRIFDIQGRMIKEIDLGKLNIGGSNFQLDASDLGKGSYLIYIISDQATKIKRFNVI